MRFGFLTYGLDRPLSGISRSTLELGRARFQRPAQVAARGKTDTDFSGSLEGIGVAPLVRLLAGLRQTGCLRIAQRRRSGALYFDQGHVVSAAFGAERGPAALAAVLRVPAQGQFAFSQGVLAGARNVDPAGDLLQAYREAAAATAVPVARIPACWLLALGYLLAITAAELLVALVDPRLGGPTHALLLWALLWHGARSAPAEQRLYWSFALAPLIRLISLALPLGRFPIIWWYAIISAPLFLAAVVAAQAMGYGAADLGLRWRWRQVPAHLLVGLLGVPLGLMEYAILQPGPLTPELTWAASWLPALILLVSTGLGEELIFRGLMQRSAQAVFGQWRGPLLVTILFAALHIGYRSWIDWAFVFLAGGLFALVAARTRSIWGVTLAHGIVNVTLFVIAPFVLDSPGSPAL